MGERCALSQFFDGCARARHRSRYAPRYISRSSQQIASWRNLSPTFGRYPRQIAVCNARSVATDRWRASRDVITLWILLPERTCVHDSSKLAIPAACG